MLCIRCSWDLWYTKSRHGSLACGGFLFTYRKSQSNILVGEDPQRKKPVARAAMLSIGDSVADFCFTGIKEHGMYDKDLDFIVRAWPWLKRWQRWKVLVYAVYLRFKGERWGYLKMARDIAGVTWSAFSIFIEVNTGVLL